jgi:RNA polymerase sigma-70 factor (ECF subfamily)
VDAQARFRALYAQAYGPLRRWAYHRGMDGADADDVVAEVFTIAWRRFDDIPADAAIPWLYGVARNVARNHARGERRRAALQRIAPRDLVAPAPDEPSDARVLGAALAALRDDDREVLRLIAWDGVEPSQLPIALGCSPAAARVRLHRARKRFADAVTRAEQQTGSGRERPLEEVRDVR